MSVFSISQTHPRSHASPLPEPGGVCFAQSAPSCASLTYISAADGKWWFIHFILSIMGLPLYFQCSFIHSSGHKISHTSLGRKPNCGLENASLCVHDKKKQFVVFKILETRDHGTSWCVFAALHTRRMQQLCVEQPHLQCDLQHFLQPQSRIFDHRASQLSPVLHVCRNLWR